MIPRKMRMKAMFACRSGSSLEKKLTRPNYGVGGFRTEWTGPPVRSDRRFTTGSVVQRRTCDRIGHSVVAGVTDDRRVTMATRSSTCTATLVSFPARWISLAQFRLI